MAFLTVVYKKFIDFSGKKKQNRKKSGKILLFFCTRKMDKITKNSKNLGLVWVKVRVWHFIHFSGTKKSRILPDFFPFYFFDQKKG